jgi:hypothetical protein
VPTMVRLGAGGKGMHSCGSWRWHKWAGGTTSQRKRDDIAGSSTKAMTEGRGFDENDLQMCTGMVTWNMLDETNVVVCSPLVRDEQWQRKGSPELERRSTSNFYFKQSERRRARSGVEAAIATGPTAGARSAQRQELAPRNGL